jgi:hypothetical protein
MLLYFWQLGGSLEPICLNMAGIYFGAFFPQKLVAKFGAQKHYSWF